MELEIRCSCKLHVSLPGFFFSHKGRVIYCVPRKLPFHMPALPVCSSGLALGAGNFTSHRRVAVSLNLIAIGLEYSTL